MDDLDSFAGLGYLGEFDHALDNQCRVAIPSEWRKKDGETRFILVPGADRDLRLFPPELLAEFIRKAKNDPFNAALQRALAWFGSKARNCCCDKQGRVKLDRAMLDRVQIGTQVKLIGAVTQIKLCAPENWTGDDPTTDCEYMEELRKVSSSGADLLAALKESL